MSTTSTHLTPSGASSASSSSAEEALLSSISCEACRHSHKKCDRKLPSCGKCTKKGIECNYSEPKKRGKASDVYKKNKKQKQDNNQTASQDELIQQICEFYFTFVCTAYPVVDKTKLEYFVNEYLMKFENGEQVQLFSNDLIQSEEELRLLYILFLSLKAIYYQFHYELDFAEEIMRKCERLLGQYLTQSFHFYIYATCQLVAVYYSGVGDLTKLKFYEHLVNFYLNNLTGNTFDLYEKNLERRAAFVSGITNDMATDGVSSFIERVPKIFQVTVDQKLENILLPGTMEFIRTAPATTQNYAFFRQVLEFVFKVIGQFRAEYCSKLTFCNTETALKFAQVNRHLIYCGFHMQYLTRMPSMANELEELALKVSCITESEYFRYCSAEMIGCVKTAADIHLRICKQIENGTRRNHSPLVTTTGKSLNIDYYSILEKDLNALTCMEKKFKRVTSICGDLIQEIRITLQNYYNRQVNTLNLATAQALRLPSIIAQQQQQQQHSSPPNSHEGDDKWMSLIKYLEAIKDRIGHQPTDEPEETDNDSFLDFDSLNN